MTVTFFDQKILATLTAQLALCGCTVYEIATGGFLVSSSRWCQSRYIPDTTALAALSKSLSVSDSE